MDKVRKTLGLVECITISSDTKSVNVLARIDTGATLSSIDSQLAKTLGLDKIDKVVRIRSAHGKSRREMVRCNIEICQVKLPADITITARGHMKYRVLLGQDILKKGRFIIDPLHDSATERCR
jgi:hypothetical protein